MAVPTASKRGDKRAVLTKLTGWKGSSECLTGLGRVELWVMITRAVEGGGAWRELPVGALSKQTYARSGLCLILGLSF